MIALGSITCAVMHDDGSQSNRKKYTSGHFVCVFGISGVGKTTLIRQFMSRHPDWHALSAGGLLGGLSHMAPTSLRLAERPVIEENQFAIAEAVQRHRRANPGSKWMLDAHSTIDNDRELVIVPTEVIARIDPDRLIFVFDDAAVIHLRRTSDSHRLRPITSLDRIEEEQRLALDTCVVYARELKLDLHRVRSNNLADFAVATEGI